MSWNHWKAKILKNYPEIESLYMTLKPEVSLLHFALAQKSIPEKEYFEWARNHYKLPLLQGFTANHFNLGDQELNQIKGLTSWNGSLVPFYIWENCLYVMGLEPYSDSNLKYKIVTILAPVEDLNVAWKFYKEKSQSSVTFNKEASLFDALKTQIVTSNFDSSDLLQDIPESSDEASSEDFESTNEMPEGFSFDSPVTQKLKSNMEYQKKEKAESFAFDGPPPFEDSLVTEINEIDPKTLIFDPSEIDEAGPPPISEISNVIELKKETDLSEKTPDLISIPDVQSINENDHDDFDFTAVQTPSSLPDSYLLDDLELKNSKLIFQEVSRLLQGMKKYYAKSLILCVNRTEKNAQLWKHDENISAFDITLPLKVPSIFYIAANSGKPFHGYVSANDVNTAFFNLSNHGSYPESATVIPFFIDNKVAGLVVGYGKLIHGLDSLTYAEKLTELFTEKLQSFSNNLQIQKSA